MKTGTVLKMIRTSMGLSQKDMANKLGITQNYLSLIEHGKKEPSSEILTQFAGALHFSKEALKVISTDVPYELKDGDREDFLKLQRNILSLLIFEVTGEIEKSA